MNTLYKKMTKSKLLELSETELIGIVDSNNEFAVYMDNNCFCYQDGSGQTINSYDENLVHYNKSAEELNSIKMV